MPPAIPLGVIVLLATAATTNYVLGLASYFIMPDELGYVKQSLSIGDRMFLLMPGVPWFNSWAQLQPLLNAPAYSLFEATTAFDVAHTTNAVVMASTAIPAYLLTRPLVPARIWAYAAAALTVAVPWLVIAGSLMTEVSAYPVFVWAVLAMQRAIARPSLTRDLLALAAIGLAFFARTQFAILGPTFLAAIVAHELGYGTRLDHERGALRKITRALRRSMTMHPVAVVAALAGAVGAAALGFGSLLGSYRVVSDGAIFPAGTLGAGREMLSYIVVGIGVLPLAIGGAWALVSLVRPDSREAHAFSVVLVLVVAVLTLMAGSFTVQFTTGINDRYLFYIVPLLFAAMMAGLSVGRRLVLPIGAAGLLVAWLIATSELAQAGPSLVSPSATFHLVLDGRAFEIGRLLGNDALSTTTVLAAATVIGTITLAAALWLLPQMRVAAVVALVVLTYGVLQTGYVLNKLGATQAGVGQEFLDNRTWANDALPNESRAAAVIGALDDPTTTVGAFWDLMFWNSQVDRVVIAVGDSKYDQPFHTRFSYDPDTGAVDGLDHRAFLIRAEGDVRFGIRGAKVIANRNLLTLNRAPRPYEAEWAVLGAGARGRVSAGASVQIRLFGDGTAGTRRVGISLTTTYDATRPYHYRLKAGDEMRVGKLAPTDTTQASLPVQLPARGHVDLELTVPAHGSSAKDGSPGLRVSNVTIDPA